TWPASGTRPERSAQPATLSTALCRPTSSRSTSRVPSGVNRPAACRPPVRLKTRCASLSRSGRPASMAGETRTGSAATSKADRTRIASMLSLPHTPQALGEQDPGGQVDVVPRGTHRHRQRLAVHPDLERLLDRQQVGPVLRHTRYRDPQHPPPSRGCAHTSEGTPRVPATPAGGVLGPYSRVL